MKVYVVLGFWTYTESVLAVFSSEEVANAYIKRRRESINAQESPYYFVSEHEVLDYNSDS